MTPRSRAAARAVSSTMPPRAALTRIAPGLHGSEPRRVHKAARGVHERAVQGDDVADGEQFVEIDAPDAVLLREILGPEDVGGHDRCPEGRKAGGQRPADAAEPDDAHGGAEQFAGAPVEDAFPCLRIGAGLDGLVRVGPARAGGRSPRR